MVQNHRVTYPASYSMGTDDSFSGVSDRGVKVTIHIPSSAEVKNEWSHTVSTSHIRLHGLHIAICSCTFS